MKREISDAEFKYKRDKYGNQYIDFVNFFGEPYFRLWFKISKSNWSDVIDYIEFPLKNLTLVKINDVDYTVKFKLDNYIYLIETPYNLLSCYFKDDIYKKNKYKIVKIKETKLIDKEEPMYIYIIESEYKLDDLPELIMEFEYKGYKVKYTYTYFGKIIIKDDFKSRIYDIGTI